MKSRLDNLVDRLYEVFATDERNNPYVNHVMRASLASADDVQVFSYGREIIPAMQSCLERAEHEVLMQFYNYQDSCDAGSAIKAALVNLNTKAKSQNKKITVKLMVNFRKGPAAYFTRAADDPFAWLQQDGSGIYFHFNEEKVYLDHLSVETKLHNHYFFDSYHSKQIIIDRKHLMLFSGDVTKVLNYMDGERRQTEVVTVVEQQQLVHNAATSFYERWNDSVIMSEKLHDEKHDMENNRNIPILLLEKKSSTDMVKRLLFRSPLKIAIAEGIRSAERNIKIVTPNINDAFIIDEIIQALKRGIVIQLFTGKFMNDQRQSNPGMGGTNLENICKIYESIPLSCWDNFRVNWACDDMKGLVLCGSIKSMHAKFIIIDDTAVLAGSSPLDKQAAFFSEESDVLIVSPLVAEKYLKIFRPAFDAGENFNFHSLLNLKAELAKDISKKIHELSVIDCHDEQINLQRTIFIDVLIKQIKDAESYGALLAILRLSVDVADCNPFAKASMQGMFSYTKAIQALTKTYGEHGVRITNDGIYTDMRRISM